jgi:NitT/TauT family transport system ATP-binding protein
MVDAMVSPRTEVALTRGMEEGARIEVRDLSVVRGVGAHQVEALRRIRLVVGCGEFVSVLGPSGCGKSTLLGAIGGFVRPFRGSVFVDEREVLQPAAERGIVFQQHSLFPWFSALENVAFGLKMHGVAASERRGRAREMMELVGLAGFEKLYPAQLSGGMQHRAEIARVLVNHPRVLLMDEPFSSLDAQTKLTMQELLLEIWAKLRTTVVFVTHDIDEAIFLGDRVVAMSSRPGEICFERAIDFARPRDVKVMTSPEFVDIKRDCLDWIRSESAHGLRRGDPIGRAHCG